MRSAALTASMLPNWIGTASAGLPGGSNTIIVGVWMLQVGEDAIVAERLYEVLDSALQG